MYCPSFDGSVSAEGRHVILALYIFIIGWSGLRTSAYVLKVAIGHRGGKRTVDSTMPPH